MRPIFLLLVLIGCVTLAQAQTRKIAHRSHSGAPNTFAMLLDDDHGGNPYPEYKPERYNLEPFVQKIRKHYEQVAKHSATPGEPAVQETKVTKPETEEPSTPEPQPAEPKTKPVRHKEPKKGAAPQMATNENPSPIPHFKLAKANPKNEATSHMNLWLFATLVLACVAPGVVLLSGARQKRS
jgi:hypothetical protein